MSDTILVIDDQANVRTLLKDYLSNQGYRIVQAQDGQQGIAIGENRVDDALDHGLGLIYFDLPAQADVAHQAVHDPVGFATQAAGTDGFCLQRGFFRRRWFGLCDVLHLLIEYRFHFAECRRAGDVVATRRIDVQLTDTMPCNFLHRGLVADMESIGEEGVIEPAAVQIMDEHPWL